LGDGRISFRSRDPEAPASRTISQDEIIGGPNIEIQTDEVVSDIQVSYSPSFIGRNVALTAEYSTGADAVTAAFAIKSTQPISPVQTVLTEEADALAVGAEVASTSQEPQEIVSITIPLTEEQIQLLEVVQVNVGRPHKEDWRVYEVLERSIGLQNSELAQDLLLRRLPGRVAVFPFALLAEDGTPILTEDGEFIFTEQGGQAPPVFVPSYIFSLAADDDILIVTDDGFEIMLDSTEVV
ncbi:MAG TPA: hypothetical protein VKP88_02170, partial [Candidatus Paceibacterota bacterium]|nr:hypothetical protein [Candidatus Paceibacterota bacterium]